MPKLTGGVNLNTSKLKSIESAVSIAIDLQNYQWQQVALKMIKSFSDHFLSSFKIEFLLDFHLQNCGFLKLVFRSKL